MGAERLRKHEKWNAQSIAKVGHKGARFLIDGGDGSSHGLEEWCENWSGGGLESWSKRKPGFWSMALTLAATVERSGATPKIKEIRRPRLRKCDIRRICGEGGPRWAENATFRNSRNAAISP